MGRARGTGSAGPVRSTRLPRALDAWFVELLDRHREQSASDLLVKLIHGGLRLREGYMAIHRLALEKRAAPDAVEGEYAAYVACLFDTFGPEYVAHLERWLEADRAGPGARPAAARTNGAR